MTETFIPKIRNEKFLMVTYNYIQLSSCAMYGVHDIYVSDGTVHVRNKKLLDYVFLQLFESKFKGNTSPIFMISPINYRSSGRSEKDYHTSDWVNWLIANKIGVVCSSLAYSNPNYSNGESVCQSWIWYPPKLVTNNYLLPNTEGVFNMPKNYLGMAGKNVLHVDTFEKCIEKGYAELPQYSRAKELWENVRKKQKVAK